MRHIDRSKSGNVGFDPSFTGLQQAPFSAPTDVVDLTVLVDWSSVEVFAQDGQALLADQIFPDPASTGIAAFATGGTAQLQSITIQPMTSSWSQ